jgi:hypothetical protein
MAEHDNARAGAGRGATIGGPVVETTTPGALRAIVSGREVRMRHVAKSVQLSRRMALASNEVSAFPDEVQVAEVAHTTLVAFDIEGPAVNAAATRKACGTDGKQRR